MFSIRDVVKFNLCTYANSMVGILHTLEKPWDMVDAICHKTSFAVVVVACIFLLLYDQMRTSNKLSLFLRYKAPAPVLRYTACVTSLQKLTGILFYS